MKKLSIHLTREVLLRIRKSLVRANLDYDDIIFDKPNNESFKSRTESIQYTASMAITEAIQGTSWERLYRELGLESLSDVLVSKFDVVLVFFLLNLNIFQLFF